MGPLGGPLFGARTLHHNEFGWDVAVLQFLLVRQGISVPINAYFDGPTQQGVRLMQQRLHVRPDGVVGSHTFAALVKREPTPLAHGVPVVAHHTVQRQRHRKATGVHVVRSGESLSSIARRYHTTVARLARLNHLDPRHFLLIGTHLRVPHARQHVATTQHVAYHTQNVASVRTLLDHWAVHYRVSVHLVRAVAWMESGYNNALVSSAGARGIMQLLPSTFRFAETVLIGHRLHHNANGNVRAGVAYLAHLLHDFHGNKRLALAGWYQGERAVRKHGLYKVSKTFVKDVLSLEKRM
jgi:LysM repeat protein